MDVTDFLYPSDRDGMIILMMECSGRDGKENRKGEQGDGKEVRSAEICPCPAGLGRIVLIVLR
jgi:hypothetical protein